MSGMTPSTNNSTTMPRLECLENLSNAKIYRPNSNVRFADYSGGTLLKPVVNVSVAHVWMVPPEQLHGYVKMCQHMPPALNNLG